MSSQWYPLLEAGTHGFIMVLHVLSICFYLGGDAILVVFAALYLLRPTVMPYHLDAIGKRWEEIEQGTQIVLLALMRAAGAGYLALSGAAACLVVGGLRRHYAWVNLTLLLTYLTLLLPLTFVMNKVRRVSPGRPPISASITGIVVAIGAFICECLS